MKPKTYTQIEIQKIEESSVALVEEQLKAYNKRDIIAFLKPFSENVKVFDFPNELFFEGKEEMKNSYSKLFENCPKLNCKTISRTVFKNIVIDKEVVTGMAKNENILPYFIAIYKIESNKINEIRFMELFVQHK